MTLQIVTTTKTFYKTKTVEKLKFEEKKLKFGEKKTQIRTKLKKNHKNSICNDAEIVTKLKLWHFID